MLREQSHRYDVRILGWCLMTNHVHLIAIPGAATSLALCVRQAHSQFSMEQNRRQGRVGHLWQNRFYSCPLGSTHLLSAMHYVDLNPVRAGLASDAWDWRWSSAQAHTLPQRYDELLDWPWLKWMEEARLGKWNYADWKTRLIEASRPAELDRVRQATKHGEPLGSEAFVRDLEAKVGRRLRVLPQGRPSAKMVAAVVNGV